MSEQTENDSSLYQDTKQKLIKTCSVSGISFDEKESVLSTLQKHKIKHHYVESLDPNDDEVVAKVNKLPERTCVYSGPGGKILRSGLFETGKSFIHAHPGKLPSYKGSTTIYYSLLIHGTISVSVIELNENLDEGDIFSIDDFKFRAGSSLDYVIDPCVRAYSLLKFFKKQNKGKKQDKIGNTFYIIHPVLKHLAVIKNKAY